ncbi:hypothetical protein QEV70_01755 [Trueperella pyogenes]
MPDRHDDGRHTSSEQSLGELGVFERFTELAAVGEAGLAQQLEGELTLVFIDDERVGLEQHLGSHFHHGGEVDHEAACSHLRCLGDGSYGDFALDNDDVGAADHVARIGQESAVDLAICPRDDDDIVLALAVHGDDRQTGDIAASGNVVKVDAGVLEVAQG